MSRPAVESTLFRARRRLTEEYDELASGQRCLRIQSIIAGAGSGRLGARDTRRLARHVAHCQPCRRQALAAGVVDPAAVSRRPLRDRAIEKVAGLFPIPLLFRGRRGGCGRQLARPAADGLRPRRRGRGEARRRRGARRRRPRRRRRHAGRLGPAPSTRPPGRSSPPRRTLARSPPAPRPRSRRPSPRAAPPATPPPSPAAKRIRASAALRVAQPGKATAPATGTRRPRPPPRPRRTGGARRRRRRGPGRRRARPGRHGGARRTTGGGRSGGGGAQVQLPRIELPRGDSVPRRRSDGAVGQTVDQVGPDGPGRPAGGRADGPEGHRARRRRSLGGLGAGPRYARRCAASRSRTPSWRR